MRSVLVCVRTPLAAHAVANAAAQLGLTDVISTAVSGADALARLTHDPADVLLVDTASVRPDTVGFTKRVLARSPDAVVVFFGPEEAAVAEGAVAAGARGLIRGGDREDLVASVAKALMLLLRSARGAGTAQPVPSQRSERDDGPGDPGVDDLDSAARGANGGSAEIQLAGRPEPAMLRPEGAGTSGHRSAEGSILAYPAGRALSTNGPPAADQPGNDVARGAPNGNGARRTALTERELQVLRGMADGKSNAEIGRELFVSEDTVKTHARRLFRKLSARDRAHAVAAAFRAGLVH